ncbi:MAG: succinylglutamate desuccinylase [Burkholderiales bacterium]|nr:MAG: succinylglutamate desuccinylase [Burkholderiales bacterium]
MEQREILAFAGGDFSRLIPGFAASGVRPEVLAPGVLRLFATAARPAGSLLLSVGVHGDETAPIALLAEILTELAIDGHGLAVELLVVVANLPAIAAGKRFLHTDLNRLFPPEGKQAGDEGERARELCGLVEHFFGVARGRRLHLDLHSTIRPSLFPCFAIIPHEPAAPEARLLCAWMDHAELPALVFSQGGTRTFSAFSARACAAAAATLELGTREVLGHNRLAPLATVASALRRMLREGLLPPPTEARAQRFRAVREIVRRNRDFALNLPPDAPNFSTFSRGERIASDGMEHYFAQEDGERILFPNADVALGARAGVMIVPFTGAALVSRD